MFEYDKECAEEFGNYLNVKDQQAHDAGYDAYMTGLVFASLSKFLEIGAIIDAVKEAA